MYILRLYNIVGLHEAASGRLYYYTQVRYVSSYCYGLILLCKTKCGKYFFPFFFSIYIPRLNSADSAIATHFHARGRYAIYILLYIYAMYVSSYCYIYMLYMCPHTAMYMLYMCPHTAIYMLYMCPHTAVQEGRLLVLAMQWHLPYRLFQQVLSLLDLLAQKSTNTDTQQYWHIQSLCRRLVRGVQSLLALLLGAGYLLY